MIESYACTKLVANGYTSYYWAVKYHFIQIVQI